jgi:Membrane domain of glycerophosphoryl diester phosphodiesterase
MSDSPSWGGQEDQPPHGQPSGQQPGWQQPGQQQPGGQPQGEPGTVPAGSGGLPRYPAPGDVPPSGYWTPPGYAGPGYGAGQPPYGSAGQPGSGQPGYGSPGYGAPGYGTPSYGPGGYGNPWGAPPPAAAPGGVPLRPLALGDILSGAFTLIRQNPVATLGIAAIIETIAAVFTTLVSWAEQRAAGQLRTTITPSSTPTQVSHAIGSFFTSFLPYFGLTLVLLFLFEGVLTGMLTGALGEGLLGRKISLGDAWRKARVASVIGVSLLTGLIFFALWVPFIGIAILLAVAHAGAAAGVIIFLGFAATGCVSLWIVIRLSLAVPAVVLESAGPATALRRSWALARGSWWRIFGILLLTVIIVFLVTAVIEIPFNIVAGIVTGRGASGMFGLGAAATAPSLVYLVIGAIGTIVATSCTRPISAGVTVLLYTDQRIRKEGLDLALAQAGLASVPGQPQQPGQPGQYGQPGIGADGLPIADPWQVRDATGYPPAGGPGYPPAGGTGSQPPGPGSGSPSAW